MPDLIEIAGSPMLTPDQVQFVLAAIPAVGAIGTAAMGLFDAIKGWWGAEAGFDAVETSVAPFRDAMTAALGGTDPIDLMRANWRNGMGKADQKTAILDMVQLAIIPEAVAGLAKALPSVDGAVLADLAQKYREGIAPTDLETAVLARLNAIIGTRLDAAFEQGEREYKDRARRMTGAISLAIGVIAASSIWGFSWQNAGFGLVIGLIAVPLAPIAKDVTAALSTAMDGFRALRR